jgi:hypothetical protein
LDFFFFVVEIAHSIDRSAEIAIKALAAAGDEEAHQRLKRLEMDPKRAQKKLNSYSAVISRNLTNAVVAFYQRYFSEIIQEVALKKPEVLRSSQAIRADEILQFTKHRDVVAFLVDKKLNELAYGGLRQTEVFFQDHLGVKLFLTDLERDLLTVFNELRNINQHNGAVINRLFLSRVRPVEGFNFSVGKRYHVDLDHLLTLTDNVIRVTARLDDTLCQKFSLKRKTLRVWLQPKRTAAPSGAGD